MRGAVAGLSAPEYGNAAVETTAKIRLTGILGGVYRMKIQNRCPLRNAVRLAPVNPPRVTAARWPLAADGPGRTARPPLQNPSSTDRALFAGPPNDVAISRISNLTSEDIEKDGLGPSKTCWQTVPSIIAESPSGNSNSPIGSKPSACAKVSAPRTPGDSSTGPAHASRAAPAAVQRSRRLGHAGGTSPDSRPVDQRV